MATQKYIVLRINFLYTNNVYTIINRCMTTDLNYIYIYIYVLYIIYTVSIYTKLIQILIIAFGV